MQPFSADTRLIGTNGVQLHVQAAGPEDGPLVILLHGFPEFWYGWRNQIPALAQAGFRVIVPDQRGYNLSDRPARLENYALEELSRDVVGLIDHFQRESAVIIGHDWGAAVAWHTAILFPERVHKLVILNVPHPAVLVQALRNPVLKQLLRSWYILFFQIPGLPELILTRNRCAAMRRMLKNTSTSGAFSTTDLDRYTEAWLRPAASPHQLSAITAMLNWYRAMFQSISQKQSRHGSPEQQNRVKLPTLVLWGQQDVALVPELAEWSLNYCDRGLLVRFPNATHWLQHDEPAAVNAHILAFIQTDK